ncbi:MAG: hypothetical protein JNL34_07190 [Anaerolineae bacterium]|nr:hypothetical protein [Anaerolineae bacterium]
MTPTPQSDNNWKLISFAAFIGGGALLGVLAALLYTRTAETTRTNQGKLPAVGTMSMIGLAISLIGLIRQIVELASED